MVCCLAHFVFLGVLVYMLVVAGVILFCLPFYFANVLLLCGFSLPLIHAWLYMESTKVVAASAVAACPAASTSSVVAPVDIVASYLRPLCECRYDHRVRYLLGSFCLYGFFLPG
jgi:hypothetical protein